MEATPRMTRSAAREIAVHLIYAVQYGGEDVQTALNERFEENYYAQLSGENEVYAGKPGPKQRAYISAVVEGVTERRPELDEIIARYSIGWNLNRISRLARAAMELAIYEALYVEDVPMNVAINEAVKLCQKYEEPETVAFVNGILGAFSREQRPEA
ncbi:MAG: transcription antitermination factor NusB [Oscillospiraceae bacterium]|nr:transcription antitermination factor NusB [Oscillospiraceae bacterium]